MRKFKVFWDFEAEEKFLNDMAREGHHLTKYSSFGVYHFTDGEPQETNYKVDYRRFSTKREFESYVTMFEDAGWKHVYGNRMEGSQYFLPIDESAGQEIFSDRESSAARYKSFSKICETNMALFLVYLVVIFNPSNMDWYQLGFLTPGLWKMTGADFWTSFLFELPFVIFRVGCPLLFLVLTFMYGYWSLRARKAYKEKREQ